MQSIKVPQSLQQEFIKRPYTIMYLLQHGDVGNAWQTGPYKDVEQLHKACLRQGKTWQQIVGKLPDDVIL